MRQQHQLPRSEPNGQPVERSQLADLADASRNGVYRLKRFSIHAQATHAGPPGTLMFSTCYDDDFRSFYAPGDITVREAELCIDAFEQGFKQGLETAPYSEVLHRQTTEPEIMSAVYRVFVKEADCTLHITTDFVTTLFGIVAKKNGAGEPANGAADGASSEPPPDLDDDIPF